ncbi:MAG: hypothetical protein MUC40_01195, partial [Akkermansiaceae bacterium]|nr:hypothetical protein [Akkermansiaceae bacterium]
AFFTANPGGRCGTILMDFADAARCALIYQTNAPATLAWPSRAGCLYQPWWSGNLTTWHKLTTLPLAGNGSPLTITDTRMPERGFYRVSVTRSP